MTTMNRDSAAETADQSSKFNAPGGPDAEQVESRQSSAGHDKRAGDIAAAMQETSAPAVGHKTELRTRVEARLAEMAAALAELGGDDANKTRARDIEAAMQAAQGWMSGGWERVGEVEAAQLAQWLEGSRNIGVTPFSPEGSQK